MDAFEALLEEHRPAVERYVRFRLPSKVDADDVLQEVYLAAWRNFHQLKAPESFKPWILRIAATKCADFFRRRAAQWEIPIDSLAEAKLSASRYGIAEVSAVREVLGRLGNRDKQILYLYYWKELPQAEIAQRLQIPLGTVKSRLHTARQNFKREYPHPPKGENSMKKLPEFMPPYSIAESPQPPFSVKWEELMGWFLVPKLGERLSWGIYDSPSGKCDEIWDMAVVGRAKVHGIEGVELTARAAPCSGKGTITQRRFVAQLTDTHCRYLASMWDDGGIQNFVTFLDGDAFLPNWGFGEDNCGNETNLSAKGDIRRQGDTVTAAQKPFLLDIVGRCTVTIGGKSYDTVCVMDIETYDSGVASEQFLDKNGRTILWRRFNRDDWAIDRYGAPWSRLLPDNQRITVNGKVYVHWYDCITDYIL